MKKSHRIALLAFELALIVIFSLMPISFGSASLALTLLPVLVIALTQDFKTAVLGGLIMGLTSLIGAFTVGAANPLVSVLPRICVPAAAWAIDKGLTALCAKAFAAAERKRAGKDVPEPGEESASDERRAALLSKKTKAVRAVADGLASLLGVCTNTAFVLGMIWLLYGGKTVGDSAITPEFMSALVSVNFVIEAVVMTVLTPPIVYAIRKQQEKIG